MENPETYTEEVPLYPVLPVEKFKLIKPSKLLFSVLLVFSFMILINVLAIVYLANDPINRAQVVVKKKWELIHELDAPLNYLVVGDSSANQGFNPQIVDDTIGLRGLNLATNGNFGFVDDVWLLETYLALHPVPQTVIVIHTYDTPQREVPAIDLIGTYAIPLSDLLNYTYMADQLSFFDVIEIYKIRILPIYYRRSSLMNALTQSFGIFEKPYPLNEDGFMSVTPKGINTFNSEPDRKAPLHLQLLKAQFSQDNLNAVNRMIDLAETYDFDLYFVNGPSYMGLEADEKFQVFRQNLHKIYRRFDEQSPNVYYIPAVFLFPAEAMVSMDHLIADAADDYTRQVMTLIWDKD